MSHARAAILAFKYGAVAIVDDSGIVLHVESFLVEGAKVADIIATIEAAGVDAVAIDRTGTDRDKAASAFLDDVLAGLEVGPVEVAHMARKAATKRADAALVGWSTPLGMYEPQAVALALASLEPVRKAAHVATASTDLAGELAVSVEAVEEFKGKASDEPTEAPKGPRTLLVDPGSAWLGAVVSEGDALPLRRIFGHTFSCGTEVKLDKPRVVKWKALDGTITEKTYETERVIRAEDMTAACGLMQDLIEEFGVTLVLVEAPERVHLRAASVGMATARSRELVLSERIGAAIVGWCIAKGIAVDIISAPDAKARVLRNRNAKKGDVAAAVRAGFADWPAGSDHEAAAGLLGIYSVTPEPAPEPKAQGEEKPRGPRSQKGRGPRRVRVEARAKIEANRRAAGCSCKIGGRHGKDCPLFTPKAKPEVLGE